MHRKLLPRSDVSASSQQMCLYKRKEVKYSGLHTLPQSFDMPIVDSWRELSMKTAKSHTSKVMVQGNYWHVSSLKKKKSSCLVCF